MKTIATVAMCAGLLFGAGVASAQSASMPMSKKANATQDCKDRTATQMGEKRADANIPNAEMDKACANAPMDSKKARKHRPMKPSTSASSAM